jgi:hypothetical protein
MGFCRARVWVIKAMGYDRVNCIDVAGAGADRALCALCCEDCTVHYCTVLNCTVAVSESIRLGETGTNTGH